MYMNMNDIISMCNIYRKKAYYKGMMPRWRLRGINVEFFSTKRVKLHCTPVMPRELECNVLPVLHLLTRCISITNLSSDIKRDIFVFNHMPKMEGQVGAM